MSTNKSQLDQRFEGVRIAGWFRWALGVFTAILVTLIIVSTTVIQNSRDGCTRAADRANAVANNWEQAAAIRRSDGDLETARIYTTNVFEIRRTIAMPDGWEGSVAGRGKDPRDREEGCTDSYPLLIPFVD
jgi:hypothetical protein